MFITVEIDDKLYARLILGRVKGSLGFDGLKAVHTFNAWNLGSKGHLTEVTEHVTASGWLRRSARKNKIFVSVNSSMGRERCASELMMQAKELTDHLRNTITIEELMDEI